MKLHTLLFAAAGLAGLLCVACLLAGGVAFQSPVKTAPPVAVLPSRVLAPAVPAPPPASRGPLAPTLEERFVAAVNAYRAGYDLPPLVVDPRLMALARERALYLDPLRPGDAAPHNHRARGLRVWDDARRVGFPGHATDNLAFGAATPEAAVAEWAAEDGEAEPRGHNYQMRGLFAIDGQWVDYRFDAIGVAVLGRNYIAIFGRKD